MAGTEAEELEGIKNVLNGTTAGTPILAIKTALESILTQLTTVNTRLAALDTTSQTIKTAIDTVDVGVTVTDVSVEQTLSTRRPLAEANTIRRDSRSRKTLARNPLKPSTD